MYAWIYIHIRCPDNFSNEGKNSSDRLNSIEPKKKMNQMFGMWILHANVEFTVATDTAAVASAAARTVLNKYAFELQILLLKIKFFFRLSSRSLALSPSRARLKNTLQNDVKWHICEPCEFEFENVIKVVFFLCQRDMIWISTKWTSR